jgi:IS605 OrfB family transposase
MITRKIEIYVNAKGQESKDYINLLYKWRKIAVNAANIVSSHWYLQQIALQQMTYLTEEAKMKVKNIMKDADGILTTSASNTTYQVLSAKFKGEIPTEILTCVNDRVRKYLSKNKDDIYLNKMSLPTFRDTMPFPFSPMSLFRNFHKMEKDRNYSFTLFGVPLCTRFGADRSNNAEIVARIVDGTYTAGISTIKFETEKDTTTKKIKRKIILMLCCEIPKREYTPIANNPLVCKLMLLQPVTCFWGKYEYEIGCYEDYLYKRTRMQLAIKRLQKTIKDNKGGKGRKQKLLSALRRFHKSEHNYIQTQLHKYSFQIIKLALRFNCDEIILDDFKKDVADAKEDDYMLRNWSFYSFYQLISYKAAQFGIKVTDLSDNKETLAEEIEDTED